MKTHLKLGSCLLVSYLLGALASAQTVTLEQSLQLAKANRPAVNAAKLALEQVRQSSRAMGSYPSTRFGVGQSTQVGLGATDLDLYVSQPLDVFGRTSANRQIGQAINLSAEVNYDTVLLNLQSEVLKSYFAAVTATRLAKVANDLLELSEGLKKATVRRFEEGKVPEVQVTRATIELDRAKQNASVRKSLLTAALKRLGGALGLETPPDAVDANANLQSIGALNVEQRPDLRLLSAQVSIANSETLAAKRSRLPELELIGLRSPWGQDPSTFGARLQLTVPIFDNGRSRAEANSARKKSESAQALFEDTKRKALAELSAIETEISTAKERVNTYREIQQSARTLVEKSQTGYSEGFSTLIDILEANRSLREIEQELAEAQLQVNLAEVGRYEATGSLLEAIKAEVNK